MFLNLSLLLRLSRRFTTRYCGIMSAFTRFIAILSLIYVVFVPSCHSLGSTDTITWGANNDRTGYEENNNTDPAVDPSPSSICLLPLPRIPPAPSRSTLILQYQAVTRFYIRVQSNGGTAIFDTFAPGAEYPQALLEFESLNGT